MSEQTTLEARLEAKRRRGEKIFVAYLTAGDPSLEETFDLVRAAARGGADLIELGVPHSDPVADGPTNLQSAGRALAQGVTLAGILELVTRLRSAGETVPLILFSYLNPILAMGFPRFAAAARTAGLDGVLVVDLPPEEAEEYRSALKRERLSTIFLASPTTELGRLPLIDEASSAFVYYVSRRGVTGAKDTVSESLEQELGRVRERVRRPVLVGFGISRPEQAAAISRFSDGVIVGSRIIEGIVAEDTREERERWLEGYVREMVGAMKGISRSEVFHVDCNE